MCVFAVGLWCILFAFCARKLLGVKACHIQIGFIGKVFVLHLNRFRYQIGLLPYGWSVGTEALTSASASAPLLVFLVSSAVATLFVSGALWMSGVGHTRALLEVKLPSAVE